MTKEIDDKKQMYMAFRNNWTVDTLKNITLNEYTNLYRNSFTYDVETGTRYLGSIKGISSFIFGIYERQDKQKKKDIRQFVYRDKYAWDKQFGYNEQEVFTNVKHWVNEIIKISQSGNYAALEEIPIQSMYKWKIAFLYQNLDDVTITPVFTSDALKWYLQTKGIYKKGMKMSEMYKAIKDYEKISSLDDAFNIANIIWDDYKNFDIKYEQNAIKHNKDLSPEQKRNATSSIEAIEYDIKAHKILRHNPHNKLEKSFRTFLESKNNVNDIMQDKAYIDFQFIYNNKKYICELKPSDDQKDIMYAIQSATGQIIRYAMNTNHDYKVIVFQGKPDNENEKYLEYLKNEHKIYYLYEDEEGVFQGNIMHE